MIEAQIIAPDEAIPLHVPFEEAWRDLVNLVYARDGVYLNHPRHGYEIRVRPIPGNAQRFVIVTWSKHCHSFDDLHQSLAAAFFGEATLAMESAYLSDPQARSWATCAAPRELRTASGLSLQ